MLINVVDVIMVIKNNNFHLRINLKKIADCSPENFRFHAYVTKDLE